MIVLLSPKWVESDFCRKEYSIFKVVESDRLVDEYVAPLLVREISGQKRHFTTEQNEIVLEVEQRQYVKTLAASFIDLTKDERIALVERIADDIAGMVERMRDLPPGTQNDEGRSRGRSALQKEFSVKARNFEEVDFIDRPEIEIHELNNGTHALLGQLDFVDRLYVQAEKARIEFGVRRAHLKVFDRQGGEIDRSEYLRSRQSNIRYVTLRDNPGALVISIDPPSGHRVLGELALPPGPKVGENRLSEIGIVPNADAADLHAEVSVSLCVEGLSFVESPGTPRSNALKAAIEAIAAIAAAKDKGASNGKMVREVRIRKSRK
ncbi:hypothetical protein NKJ40_26765 [Mesorhizobium sp. M0119]|uniref:hypothetical protein n=1 Tax=Mesorhizobium sp. M0119 TaxID=2956885 RepID=UPI00333B8597